VADQPQPRRQERGRRRIELVLDTAAEMFAEQGYAEVSTNAIARRAGMSPGSLYQFFANKEAIAEALAERYLPELAAAHAGALAPDIATVDLDELLDRLVDPIVAVHVRYPGMKELFGRPGLPSGVTAPAHDLRATVRDRIAHVVRSRMPHLDAAAVDRHTSTLLVLVGTFVPMAVAADTGAADRDEIVREFKTVLRGYMRQIGGDQ
jgi:AcrR family transcriptional regulator